MPHYNCPYCDEDHNDIDDMYEENTSYEIECTNCEKVFHVTVEYHATYDSHTDEVEKENIARKKAYQERLKNLKL